MNKKGKRRRKDLQEKRRKSKQESQDSQDSRDSRESQDLHDSQTPEIFNEQLYDDSSPPELIPCDLLPTDLHEDANMHDVTITPIETPSTYTTDSVWSIDQLNVDGLPNNVNLNEVSIVN